MNASAMAVKGHADFIAASVRKMNPHFDWVSRPMMVRHKDRGTDGDAYPITAMSPPDWEMPAPGTLTPPKEESIGQSRFARRLKKAADAAPEEKAGGRWITMHPHGEDEPGQPVYIVPNPDGSHSVAGGAGGKLNGLRLLGVKSEQEYAHMARQKREEKRRQGAAQESLKRAQMGAAAYEQQKQQKQASAQESAATTHDKQRAGIAAVFAAQGIDPSLMQVPKHLLDGADAKTVATVEKRYHKKLWAYAKQLEHGVKALVAAGIEGLSEGTVGDLGIGDLVHVALGDRGSGYLSPVSAMSDDLGLSQDERNAAVEGVKTRSLLERSDMDLGAAKKKQETSRALQAARRESEAKVKRAVADLAESGVGPEAIAQFSTSPKIENVGQAVEILRAMREAHAASEAEDGRRAQLALVDDLSALPKAALVTYTPMSDSEALNAIAGDLDEETRRTAMTGLIGDANAVEAEHGTLRQHISVGQNLAFNTVLSEVEGASIDPLVHDLLGATGAAQVVAARWRAAMPQEKVEKLAQVLGDHHVKTQVALAKGASQEAGEYLARAQQLADESEAAGPPSSPEALEAALLTQQERIGMIGKAREVLGNARGRVEAAAALNYALQQPKGADVRVSLGAMPAARAFDAAYALGLSTPTLYNPETGEMTRQGDFDVKHDGKNAILVIGHEGVQKLAGNVDHAAVARADRSRSIKRGDNDEAGFIPEGMTRRPVSSYETDPLQIKRNEDRIGLGDEDTVPVMQTKAAAFIGKLMNAGRDPKQIDSLMRSEEFVASCGLSPESSNRYLGALRTLTPEFTPAAPGSDARAELDRYKEWQNDRASRYQGFLDSYVSQTGESAVALDRQHLPTTPLVSDCLYTTLLADPRLRHGFTPLGDLDRDGRAGVRRWAYENLFGLDPSKTDDVLTPLSDMQRHAWSDWNALSDTHGDPYAAIQAHWRGGDDEDSSSGVDLFGDAAPTHPLASVDLGDDVSVLAAARAVPKLLGYSAMQAQDGNGGYKSVVPDLEASPDRPESTIVQDAKGRIRKALREHFLSEMCGFPDLAAQGWSPLSVRTASDRWADYARSMGEEAAYGTVQEFMQGKVAAGFAKEYSARSGTPLALGSRPVGKADRHAEAMLTPEQREAREGVDSAARAQLMRRSGGRFAQTGAIRDQAELKQEQESEGARLIDAADPSRIHVETERPTIGASAEAALAGMAPNLDVSRRSDAARGLNFSNGKGLPIQRAIKLIEANERQGVNLGTGTGKTPVAIGAFTHLRAQGKANRQLVLVPSNIVDQFAAEIDKFRDPAVPLTKFSAGGATSTERRAAMGDANTHICVMTPEALREDITAAVADNEKITHAEAAARISDKGADPFTVRDMIHRAMGEKGYNFDFVVSDEGHRMLQRQGKPDAHMQRVGDAVSSRAKYYAYSTADPVKNDASEAWSALNKIDPVRYPPGSQGKFIRQYGRNTLASGLALRRVTEPYLYPVQCDLGIQTNQFSPGEGALPMTPDQQSAHDAVVATYDRARIAKLRGSMDLEALQQLAPGAFKGIDPGDRAAMRAAGKRVGAALATTRDAALSRIVNAHSGGVKENYVANFAAEHKGEPTVIFAHLRASVKSIAARLTREGHRVVVLTGDMSTDAKTQARLAFQPPGEEPAKADILISSDAGAVGANLQNGKHLINVDTPQTAMLHQQRIGRIRRIGQKSGTINVIDLVANSDYDQRARRLLEQKSALREILTNPVPSGDDSGLSEEIEQAGIRKVLMQSNRGESMQSDAA